MTDALDLHAQLTLVALPPAFGMRNVSPFCLKSEMLLKQLGLPHEFECEADPRKAPKGKLPYLLVGDERLADSELIAEYLDRRTAGGVFGRYSRAEKSLGWAMTRLAEEHLYWIIVASRWLDDAWWPNVVEGFFGEIPALLRPVVTHFARRQVEQTYHLHGLGRHSLEEQKGFAHRDLEALAGAIGSADFLMGDSPGYFDFAVASILAGIYDNRPGTWLTTLAESYPDLRNYADRVQSEQGVFGREI